MRKQLILSLNLKLTSLLAGFLLFISACSSSLPADFSELTANADSAVGDCAPTELQGGSAATAAAQALLDEVGTAGIQFELNAPQRYTWSVLPVPIVERPDQGARIGDLSQSAKANVCQLVNATLSKSGVELVYGSMSSDELLGITLNRWDREYTKDNYWVSIFGDPAGDAPWAYQIEGHHLGINVMIHGDEIIAGPLLFGGYPLIDEDGTPFLVEQEALPLAFAALLSTEQRSQMTISDTPTEVDVDSADANYQFLEPSTAGLTAGSLNLDQQTALTAWIGSYVDTLPTDQAIAVKESIAAELDQAIVSWEGGTEAKPFGYGIRLPSLHILYSNEDEPNHAHIIFRMPSSDYGKSIKN